MQEMMKMMMANEKVVTRNARCVYENDDILVEHSVMDFPDGTTEAVMAVHMLQDGKIIRTETGATLIPRSENRRQGIQYETPPEDFVTYRACGSCFSMDVFPYMGFETGQQYECKWLWHDILTSRRVRDSGGLGGIQRQSSEKVRGDMGIQENSRPHTEEDRRLSYVQRER